MKTRSAKNKGKLLQNWVRDRLIHHASLDGVVLNNEDVRSVVMGESGADIVFSEHAKTYYGTIAVECKSRKSFKVLYDMYHQADQYLGNNVLVIKQNRSKPLAVVDADWLFEMLAKLGKQCLN